jgi:hypothetical protein
MLSKLRSYRASHGTVVAYLALFVALGGSSYAAVAITGRDVRDGSLTGRDIRNNSLTGRDVRGITGRDVRNNSLTGADVARLRRADFVPGALTPTSHFVVENDSVGPDGSGSPKWTVRPAKSSLVAASPATSSRSRATWPPHTRSHRRAGS